MISTSDFKKGARILVDGEPYSIESISISTPTARGAATLVRCKLRNIVSGVQTDKTFKGGDKFQVPDVSMRKIQFLYDDGESCHFMDTENYDQFSMANESIEDIRPWLVEEMRLDSVLWNDNVTGVSLPQYVEAVVDMVGAGSRNDTAGGKNLKEATLTNGLTIKVPLFIDSGEKIVVDPSTGEFVKRA
jgi:elongation factor P